MPMHNPLWALLPENAPVLLTTLAREQQRPDDAVQAQATPVHAADTTGGKGYTVSGGVAVIPVSGPITQKTVYSYWSGKALSAGQDAIGSALLSALADNSVKAVLLAIDSPGGTVAGTKELADKIAEASKIKPMAAYADGLMTSAAMWLGAATGRVYAPITAIVGSVGVIMVHTDFSKLNERWGVSYSYITGGRLKSAGNQDEPLSDEARALFQKQVSAIHEIFKSDVIRGLGITAPAEQWAEGQTMLAGEAQNLGLVSTVVRDLETAIKQLSQEATMDYATFAAQHPDLLAEVESKAKAAALDETKNQTAQAVSAAQDSVLAMVKAVAGEDVAGKVQTLIAGNITPEQVEIMGSILGASIASAAPAASGTEKKGDDIKGKILSALQNASAKTVDGVPPSADFKQSKLVADAERRVAKA